MHMNYVKKRHVLNCQKNCYMSTTWNRLLSIREIDEPRIQWILGVGVLIFGKLNGFPKTHLLI